MNTACGGVQMDVVKSHGCICLTGPAIERTSAHALSFLHNLQTHIDLSCQLVTSNLDELRPHVTLVTKEELAACTVSRSDLLQDFQSLNQNAFISVGIAVADAAGIAASIVK